MKALELPLEDFAVWLPTSSTSVLDVCALYERSTFPQTTGAESERLFDLDLPDAGTQVAHLALLLRGRFSHTLTQIRNALVRNFPS